MKPVNEILLEKQISHSVYLERYKNAQAKAVVTGLAKMYKKLIGDLSLYSEDQLLRIGNQLIGSAISAGSAPVFADYLEELKAFADKEGGYQVKVIENTMPIKLDLKTISPTQLWATIESKPFQGALMKDHLSKFTTTQIDRVWGAVQQGIVEGKPLNDILRVVRGTRENTFTDGIIARNGREAETLVRTSIGHAAAETRKMVGKENADVIGKELWVSTLDGRTTPICQAMDGATREPGESVWSNGEYGEPGMIHWNCRSTLSFVTKSWKELGIDVDEMEPGTRSSIDGQIPADVTYQTWLKGQDRETIDDILGPARAELFVTGKETLNSFVNDGKLLTLEQLHRR